MPIFPMGPKSWCGSLAGRPSVPQAPPSMRTFHPHSPAPSPTHGPEPPPRQWDREALLGLAAKQVTGQGRRDRKCAEQGPTTSAQLPLAVQEAWRPTGGRPPYWLRRRGAGLEGAC